MKRKKQAPRKNLFLSVEKVRDLRPLNDKELEQVNGGGGCPNSESCNNYSAIDV